MQIYKLVNYMQQSSISTCYFKDNRHKYLSSALEPETFKSHMSHCQTALTYPSQVFPRPFLQLNRMACSTSQEKTLPVRKCCQFKNFGSVNHTLICVKSNQFTECSKSRLRFVDKNFSNHISILT